MRFAILGDSHWEARLDEISEALADGKFREFFEDRFYDDSGLKISVILMCRDPRLEFKRRIRYSRSENKLYMDVMLDFNEMKQASSVNRKRIVAEKVMTDVPQTVAKYKFKNFDLKRFSQDLLEWFEVNHWLGK